MMRGSDRTQSLRYARSKRRLRWASQQSRSVAQPDGCPARDLARLNVNPRQPWAHARWSPRQRQVDTAARLVARHLTLGHPPAALIATLAHALLREDAGFHA